MFRGIFKNLFEVITLIDMMIAALYLVGYIIVTGISYIHGDGHCYAYVIISSAAAGHFILIIIRLCCPKGAKQE